MIKKIKLLHEKNIKKRIIKNITNDVSKMVEKNNSGIFEVSSKYYHNFYRYEKYINIDMLDNICKILKNKYKNLFFMHNSCKLKYLKIKISWVEILL